MSNAMTSQGNDVEVPGEGGDGGDVSRCRSNVSHSHSQTHSQTQLMQLRPPEPPSSEVFEYP